MDDFRKNPGGIPPFCFLQEEESAGAAQRRKEQWREPPGRKGMALPFYLTYPLPMFWEEEDAAARDLDYLLQLYPQRVRKYRERISRILDGMDYRGSLIYDEYPDRLALVQLSENIRSRICREEQEEAAAEEKTGKEAAASAGEAEGKTGTAPGKEAAAGKEAAPGGEMQAALIQVLLYYEIYRRRRKSGRIWQGWGPER